MKTRIITGMAKSFIIGILCSVLLFSNCLKANASPEDFELGLDVMDDLFGPEVAAIFPYILNPMHMSYYPLMVESYGNMYKDAQVSMKVRELCVIASAITLNLGDGLDFHFISAMNAGATQKEIRELILRLQPYVGAPLVMEAFTRFNSKLEEYGIPLEVEPLPPDWDEDVWYQSGMNNIVNYFGRKGANDVEKLLNKLEFSDENVVATAIFEYDYGKAFDDTALDDGTFALCAISSLVAQQSDFALEYHVKQALKNGVSKREIQEVVFVNHSFIGWPRTFDFLKKMGKCNKCDK